MSTFWGTEEVFQECHVTVAIYRVTSGNQQGFILTILGCISEWSEESSFFSETKALRLPRVIRNKYPPELWTEWMNDELIPSLRSKVQRLVMRHHHIDYVDYSEAACPS